MKFLKSISQGAFSVFSLVMICAIVSSCDTKTKTTAQEEDSVIEETVIVDSTFIDENAKYGRLITNVSDLKGSQVFFNNCELGRYLVQIDTMSIYRNPENGVLQIGQLAGKVVWGEVPWVNINVDNTERFTELGWESLDTFENFSIENPGSLKYVDVKSMNWGTVLINDYEIVVMRDLEGTEYPSNSKVSIGSSDLDDIECIAYKSWNCSNVACSRLCQDLGGDCNCPGFGFCAYTLNPQCMVINCKKKCVRYWPIRGIAWCECE